jgi:hypothetical protein
MSKTATATKPKEEVKEKEERRELATAPLQEMPAWMAEEAKKDAGKGVSTDAADNIVPLIYVLQPLSPQVDPSSPAFVEGASPGKIWLRQSTPPIIDGEDGILFQPCYFYKDWIEWTPRDRGGGLVAVHAELILHKDYPKVRTGVTSSGTKANEVPSPKNPKTMIWVTEAGNELRETRHHAGFVYLSPTNAVPYVINFSSTGHTTSKNWMFTIQSKRTASGEILPSFSSIYKLTTRQRSNNMGKWYVLEPAWSSWVDPNGYKRGKELHDAFASGEKQAEVDEAAAGVETAGDPDMGAPTGEMRDEVPF